MWSEMCFPSFKRSSRRKLGGASVPFLPCSTGWLKKWKRISFCVNLSLWTISETQYLELCKDRILFFLIWLTNQTNERKKFFSDWLICFVWMQTNDSVSFSHLDCYFLSLWKRVGVVYSGGEKYPNRTGEKIYLNKAKAIYESYSTSSLICRWNYLEVAWLIYHLKRIF